MKLRIASLFSMLGSILGMMLGLFGGGAAYGQTISPAVLPSSSNCSLPFSSAANITCVTANTSYTAQLTVNNPPITATAPPLWVVSTGVLPPGLLLDQSGRITGLPSSAGVYNFTIVAIFATVSINVTSPGYAMAIQSSPLSVVQTPLHSAAAGVPFTPQTFTAAGGFPFINSTTGVPYYHWSFQDGTNADGLVIDPNTGVVSGTPTSPGTFSITIGAIDALGDGAIYKTALAVSGSSAITITTGSTLPAGAIGTFYTQTVTAVGGTSPYTWTLVSGALPAGLTLSSAGVISGTPTTSSTLTFSLTATDAVALSGTGNFSLTIGASGSTFSSALRIADVVDGGGWSTLFYITNLDTVATTYTTNFWGDNGSALAVPIAGGSPGVVSGTLAPGAAVFAQTAGTASTATQGWAEISSSGHIGVEAIFRFTAPGVPDSQGTVVGMTSSASLVMPFDNTAGYITGVALANTNATTTLNVTMTFTTDTGNSSSGVLSLPAHGHTTFVLPTQFTTTANARGTIRFTVPTADLAVSGFRFTPSLSFTSLAPLQ